MPLELINPITNATSQIQQGNYLALPIGSIVPVWSNITGITIPPTTNFIILTKDLTGSGAYNENKLTGQATVTAGLTNVRRYTAVISDATSPINGQTVTLINSTEVSNTAGTWTNLPSVLGATDSLSTVFYQNQFQGNKIQVNNIGAGTQTTFQSGSILYNTGGGVIQDTTIITDGTNGTPRTGTQTRQDTYSAIYYMRYK